MFALYKVWQPLEQSRTAGGAIMNYRPKVIKGTVKNTGTPLDGCTLSIGLWDYDKSSYHLYGWGDDVDEKVMQTMHQTDELYQDDTEEEFAKLWKAKEYEPDGVYCIDLDKVDVIEVIQEEVQS